MIAAVALADTAKEYAKPGFPRTSMTADWDIDLASKKPGAEGRRHSHRGRRRCHEDQRSI
ncbi:MAG: hypothetical protein Q8M26_17305 [Pseudolabrys sp.]|nr:hypothetical protein [Pseudolabrys sp.]